MLVVLTPVGEIIEMLPKKFMSFQTQFILQIYPSNCLLFNLSYVLGTSSSQNPAQFF